MASSTVKTASVSTIVVTSLMLFSMFFGAGNLIFPPMLGVDAGKNFWPAIIGFLGAGVLLPVLAVIAIALSGDSVRDLAKRAGSVFGLIFPVLAYLSIGTFYALPRTGAVSFETAIKPLTHWDSTLASGIFAIIFFGISLALSWNPNTISSTLGRFLTPILVTLIFVLIIISMVKWDTIDRAPTDQYANAPMAAGLLEGYLTMDAIAALAFCIVVISTFRYHGVSEGRPLVTASITAGLGAGALLAVIYVGLGVIGRIMPGGEKFENGASLLATASHNTMGSPGQILFAAIVVLACLTTSVGLITSTSEFFAGLAPGISYHWWAVIFSVASAAMATAGLDTVLSIAAPVIGFIYPPAITLIFLAMIEPIFRKKMYFHWMYLLPIWVSVIWSGITTLADLGLDFLSPLVSWAPMQEQSLGWALPVVVAIVLAFILDKAKPTEPPAQWRERVAAMTE